MIKVAVLTTVWERPFISVFHFKWMFRFQQQAEELGIKLIPYYVLSEDDKCIELFKRTLRRHRHNYVTLPSQRLSDKSQAGLDRLRMEHDFDWLMHLDSDEVLSFELLRRWKKQFQKSLWFGSRSCYFLDIETQQTWEFTGYLDHPVKNGGTCLHRQVLEHCQWILWKGSRNQGLNIMERRRVESFGYQIQPVNAQDCYGVVEIKGGNTAIHSLTWFQKRGMLNELNKESRKDLLSYHPDLALLV